jgi:cytohesin
LFNLFISLDLTPSEQQLLLQIRRRKATLLKEISQLQSEIEFVSGTLGTQHIETPENRQDVPLADPEPDAILEDGEATAQANRKLMSLGCKKFNMDPKKGIEFLVANKVLEAMEVGVVAQVR